MIKETSPDVWNVPREKGMHVPGRIFASKKLIGSIERDKTLQQIKNVAMLPGIVEASMAMPDAHQGYGFPIGGVAAFDLKKGIISPGGVGYDINCGVRLLATTLTKKEFMRKREAVLNDIYKHIPSGVGETSAFKLSDAELGEVLEKGMKWALTKGYATKDDCEKTEDNGCITGADASKVSVRAKARGKNQLGTLGSGNHFIELQAVEDVFDSIIAKKFGLKKDQIVIMIHCGSRGMGHQVASDYIMAMEKEYGFEHLPDRELACAPISSPLGKAYRAAMACAANFAFVNRQLITHQIRKSLGAHFPRIKINLVYDIAHNIAKFEEHIVGGKKQEVCVHRKGATRSFGPGRKEIPSCYRKIGCPIFLPGSMGTYSYVLIGTKEAERISFGSTAHGAGRVYSRSYAITNFSLTDVKKQLDQHDVLLKSGSAKGILEEAPEVYKNIDEVARVSDQLGIGKLVARLKPLAVVKG